MYVRTYVRITYVRTYVRTYVCMYVCMYVRIYICTCVRMYVCMKTLDIAPLCMPKECCTHEYLTYPSVYIFRQFGNVCCSVVRV